MAKLENVKTIDMVNGEITKVEYNGEIYVKVEGTPAEKGDLIKSKKENRDITLGAFYKSISTGDRRPEFYDDVNDDAYLDEEDATVFRKQSALLATESLDERVSVLESKVATLEGEQGETTPDRIEVVKCLKGYSKGYAGWSKGGQGIAKIGSVGEIVSKEEDGIYVKFSEDKDSKIASGCREKFFLKHGEYKVLPKSETITHNGAEYKLVDRKAQPGDVVVFTGSHANYIKNYKSYGPVSSAVWFIDEEGDEIPVYTEESDRTLSNVKVYEPVAQPLKVGDYAKVICERYGHGFSIGDIVELAGDGHNPNFMALRVTDSEEWYVSNEEIVRATDEEVAEAKAQAEHAAVEAKWAKIGRKPNEFKKGDIVRVVNGKGSTVKEGEIGEAGETEYGLFRVNTAHASQGNYQRVKDVELITPVESRFDRA